MGHTAPFNDSRGLAWYDIRSDQWRIAGECVLYFPSAWLLSVEFEHMNDEHCWCMPELLYSGEEGEESVWIHRRTDH
jgi:hypothetical protein